MKTVKKTEYFKYPTLNRFQSTCRQKGNFDPNPSFRKKQNGSDTKLRKNEHLTKQEENFQSERNNCVDFYIFKCISKLNKSIKTNKYVNLSYDGGGALCAPPKCFYFFTKNLSP